MNVINYIIANWDFIALIAAAAAGVGYAIFRGNKSVVTRMLFNLVTEAEKEYGDGTGALKLAQVMTEIYPKLPAIIKAFASEALLTKWIEEALESAKHKWTTNPAIATYIATAEADAKAETE